MRRRSLVAVLFVALSMVVLAVVVVLRRSPPPAPDEAPVAAGQPRAGRAVPIGNLVGGAEGWLGQRGVLGHRIAGRVVHAGAPVARARTRLVTEELHVGEWTLAEVETDEAGHFDFGARPATRFRVVAQAEGLVASGQVVDLRAPDLHPAPDALEIELRDCTLVVSGTVRDAAGGVIALAHVRAGTFAEEFGGMVADAEGRYHLCLSAGPVHIEASADGYGSALEHRQGRRELRVDFALSPEVVIAGRVVDESGAPAPGVAVAAQTNGHDPGKLVDSDGDGKFRLDGLAIGSYRVSARDDGRAAEKTVLARTAGETVEVELGLETRAELTGRVVVAGQPESGATISIKDSDDRVTLGSAVSQRDGRFAIGGLPVTGTAHVEVEGHKLVKPAGTLDLATVHDVELVCERMAKVSGRVMRQGQPVARAQVRISSPRRPTRVLSDPDGTFVFEGVQAGTYELDVESLADGAMMTHRTLEVGARDIENVVCELDLAAAISGVVVDAAGAPVAGAYVSVLYNSDSGFDTTAADGTFTANTLAGGGDYVPTVYSSSSMAMAYPPAAGGGAFPGVRVADGKSRVTGVRLVVARGDLSISGKVVRGGEPVAGVNVQVRSDHGQSMAQSGADGAFVVTGLSAGSYRVGIARNGRYFTSDGIEAKAGDRDVRLELPPVGSIEGELVGFSGQKHVFARGEKGGFPAEVIENHFSISDVTLGTYTVQATATNGGHDEAKVTVAVNQVSRLILKAGPTAHIDGTVTDWRTGAPVADAFCGWQAGANGAGNGVQADAAGALSMDVPADAVKVSCYGSRLPSAPARAVEVNLAPGASAHVAIQLILAKNPTEHRRPHFAASGDPLRIEYVEGTAQSAGLLVGDLLVAVDGQSVAGLDGSAADFLTGDHPPGQAVKITVERNGARLSLDVSDAQ